VTRRNLREQRLLTERWAFITWRGNLHGAVRAYRMELRAMRHLVYIGRKTVAECWKVEPRSYCSPHHMMTFSSGYGGSK